MPHVSLSPVRYSACDKQVLSWKRALTGFARLGLMLVIVACIPLRGAEPAATNRPGMEGVTYRFFDDRTGGDIGRLRIERVTMEYGRRGFLRVAWQPQVVLEGVTLEIVSGAPWPAAGTQILEALRAGGREAGALHNLTLLPAGTSTPKIVAPVARLRADGAIECVAAAVSPAGGAASVSETGCFWLSGPLAGRWIPRASIDANATPTLSTASLQPSVR